MSKQRTLELIGHVAAAATVYVVGLAGIRKTMDLGKTQQDFVNMGFPAWFGVLTAALEVLVIPLVLLPKTRVLGSALAASVMLGAIGTHVANGMFGGPATQMFVSAIVALVTASLAGVLSLRRAPVRAVQA